MEVARGTPPRFGNPAPSLTKGGRRSLPPGQHLTAADAPAARRWSLSAGHHFSAPAHLSGRPQQQQAVFRATDYPAGAPCAPVLLRGSEGPTGAGGAGWLLALPASPGGACNGSEAAACPGLRSPEAFAAAPPHCAACRRPNRT